MKLRCMVDTPFPFPFAQLVEVLLMAFTILLPIAAAGYLYSTFLVWIFTLTTVLAFRTVNEVSSCPMYIRLESPPSTMFLICGLQD